MYNLIQVIYLFTTPLRRFGSSDEYVVSNDKKISEQLTYSVNPVFVLRFDPDVTNNKLECYHLDGFTMPINTALIMLHVVGYLFVHITSHTSYRTNFSLFS
jgi:hypothetical protein